MRHHVSYTTEQTVNKEKALIVYAAKNSFVSHLKEYLKKHDITVYMSAQIPPSTSLYRYIFVVGTPPFIKRIHSTPPHVVHIIFASKMQEEPQKRYTAKTIIINGSEDYAIAQLDTIMWFTTNKDSTSLTLRLESPFSQDEKKTVRKVTHHKPMIVLSPFWIRVSVCIVIFSYLFGFFIPLFAATYLSYRAVKALPEFALATAEKNEQQKEPLLALAHIMYVPVRPLYLLFSLAQTPEDLFYINTVSSHLIITTKRMVTVSSQFTRLVFQSNRTEQTARNTRASFDVLETLLSAIEEDVVALYRKIPSFVLLPSMKKTAEDGIAHLQKTKKMMAHLPVLLGEQDNQKILLLFANNMELRPGGGFIGSFGVLNLHYFGLEQITIYDVYDADGQLVAHVEPPVPIRQYLGQPHWYLRDSAFFPDFTDTYKQAEFFLDKELGMSGWTGSVLITTSAVKEMIGAFHDIYLPDYHDHITKDNFYIKTQNYAEHDFFPGSTQKKSFLSTLTKQLFSQLEHANAFTLGNALIQAFDQKNMVAHSDIDSVQSTLNDLYWSGQVASPFCPPSQPNCYSDYQFALDANLGVNKANFYIDRSYNVQTTIDMNGLVTTTMTLTYKNSALADVYPGGTYVNYFQVLLPLDARILSVATDEMRLSSYDSQSGANKSIGFLLNIPPQTTKTVSIRYTSSALYKKGKAVYQLVLQKQIGAFSNDLALTVTLPQNMHLINTNFSPLVKNSQIHYNTDLSTDRVFFIELLKE